MSADPMSEKTYREEIVPNTTGGYVLHFFVSSGETRASMIVVPVMAWRVVYETSEEGREMPGQVFPCCVGDPFIEGGEICIVQRAGAHTIYSFPYDADFDNEEDAYIYGREQALERAAARKAQKLKTSTASTQGA